MQNQSNLKAKTESVNKVETSKEKNIKILLKERHEIITDTNEKQQTLKQLQRN